MSTRNTAMRPTEAVAVITSTCRIVDPTVNLAGAEAGAALDIWLG